jgi:hypothetical protein
MCLIVFLTACAEHPYNITEVRDQDAAYASTEWVRRAPFEWDAALDDASPDAPARLGTSTGAQGLWGTRAVVARTDAGFLVAWSDAAGCVWQHEVDRTGAFQPQVKIVTCLAPPVCLDRALADGRRSATLLLGRSNGTAFGLSLPAGGEPPTRVAVDEAARGPVAGVVRGDALHLALLTPNDRVRLRRVELGRGHHDDAHSADFHAEKPWEASVYGGRGVALGHDGEQVALAVLANEEAWLWRFEVGRGPVEPRVERLSGSAAAVELAADATGLILALAEVSSTGGEPLRVFRLDAGARAPTEWGSAAVWSKRSSRFDLASRPEGGVALAWAADDAAVRVRWLNAALAGPEDVSLEPLDPAQGSPSVALGHGRVLVCGVTQSGALRCGHAAAP